MIDLAAAMQLREEGWLLREIGELMGVSRATVSKFFGLARLRGEGPPVGRHPLRRIRCDECLGLHTASRMHTSPIKTQCPNCRAVFTGLRRRKFCSDRCAIVYHRQADRDRRAASRHTTRPSQLIYRQRIFERDGWICGICSEPVDPSLSALDDLGPTLDHIVPLSRGGQHVESNVQLAHWRCNRIKGPGRRRAA